LNPALSKLLDRSSDLRMVNSSTLGVFGVDNIPFGLKMKKLLTKKPFGRSFEQYLSYTLSD